MRERLLHTTADARAVAEICEAALGMNELLVIGILPIPSFSPENQPHS
ncbi:MAG: hypothetical protein KAU29_06070 [Gammaproteobacteria bacterium]|nr:hypothetical protein [Gammaproteobacteria bacterium]